MIIHSNASQVYYVTKINQALPDFSRGRWKNVVTRLPLALKPTFLKVERFHFRLRRPLPTRSELTNELALWNFCNRCVGGHLALDLQWFCGHQLDRRETVNRLVTMVLVPVLETWARDDHYQLLDRQSRQFNKVKLAAF